MTVSQFRHQPLATPTSIRLVKLFTQPLSEDTWDVTQLCCSIGHFELGSAPQYIALSYLWGDPTPTKQIFVFNDSDDFQTYQVHENLWHMLHCIAVQRNTLKVADSFFWTDFLCLDQSNQVEIGEQMSRMSHVYTSATKVISWLGHEESVAESLQTLNDLEWETIREWVKTIGSMNQEQGTILATWQYLFDLEYWKRVWVFQEVVLAKDLWVMAGTVVVKWPDFIDKLLSPPISHRAQLEVIYKMRWSGRRGDLLCNLIKDSSLRRSSKVVDQVYGLLGLVENHKDGTSPAVLIDARPDKTPAEVFWDTFFECRERPDALSETVSRLLHMLEYPDEPRGPWLDIMLEDLRAYMISVRTNTVHAAYAGYALAAFEAWYSLIRQISGSDYQWHRTIAAIFEALHREQCTMTRSQEVVAISLALAASPPIRVTDYPVVHGSGWRCEAHCTTPLQAPIVETKVWSQPLFIDSSTTTPGYFLESLCGFSASKTPCRTTAFYWTAEGSGSRLVVSQSEQGWDLALHLECIESLA